MTSNGPKWIGPADRDEEVMVRVRGALAEMRSIIMARLPFRSMAFKVRYLGSNWRSWCYRVIAVVIFICSTTCMYSG